MMRLSLLLSEEYAFAGEDIEIRSITSRPEAIVSGCCFVFLRGVFADKEYILHEAIKRRPAAIICEEGICTDIPLIRVKNARKTFSHMLYRFYFHEQKPPRLIGVTGTNGKSSVCCILIQILKKRFKTGLIGTQRIEYEGKSLAPKDYTMTTPDPELLYSSLYQMKARGCELVVMEVSSHALALEKVSPLIFDIAIFTGLGEDHLDFHKTKEAYKKAKEKIFSQSLYAVLNTDDQVGQEYQSRIKIPSEGVGSSENADYEIRAIRADGFGKTRFSCEKNSEKFDITIPLLGDHNARNAAYALCAARRLGLDAEDIISDLGRLTQIKGRLEIVEKNPTVVLDYAHTPSSIEAVLRYIYNTKQNNARVIVVFGAGGDRDRSKRPVMSRTVEKYADFCVVSTDNARSESQLQIFKDLKRGFLKSNHRFITDRTRAIAFAYGLCERNDILVLLGKGHEGYILKKNERVPYSELYALYLAKKEKNK